MELPAPVKRLNQSKRHKDLQHLKRDNSRVLEIFIFFIESPAIHQGDMYMNSNEIEITRLITERDALVTRLDKGVSWIDKAKAEGKEPSIGSKQHEAHDN